MKNSQNLASGIYFMGILALSACSPKKTDTSAKNQESKSTAQSQELNQDEKIDIPSNIAGSYLVCALRKEAKVDDLDAQYGCRLTDSETNKKLDLDALGKKMIWGSSIAEGVKIQSLEATSIYHAYYNLSGANLEAIADLARKLEVIASLRLDSGSELPIKREKISTILKPVIELEDFQAPIIRDQSITPDRPGSL